VATDNGANLSGASVTVTSGFNAAQDVLAFGALPTGVSANTLTPGTITFSGVASVAAYQALLQSVTYRNTSDFPTTTPRVFSFTVTDSPPSGSLLTSPAATRTVTVVSVNDAPTVTGPAGPIYIPQNGSFAFTGGNAV